MRLSHTAYATTAAVVFSLLLSACAYKGVSPRVVQQGTIQLQVVPQRNTNKLQKTGRLICMSPVPEGCIKVPAGDTAKVTFRLVGKPDWHLTKITLCRESGDDPCALTLPERAEFEFTPNGAGDPAYPNENGEVDLTQLGADLQEFVLVDRNTIERDYEYTIEACKGDECTTMDPPLENGGLGVN